MIVLQMLFDSEHLENYITRKIHQFSSNVQIAENISQALQSPEAERIIDQRLDYLYSQPEADYLQALGLSRERIRPMIRPAVVSLCAESAPYVLDLMRQPDVEQVCAIIYYTVLLSSTIILCYCPVLWAYKLKECLPYYLLYVHD